MRHFLILKNRPSYTFLKKSLIALQFLTILPIKIKSDIKEEDFGGSLIFFPLVGLIIGLVLTLINLLSGFLPSMVSGVIILTANVIISGAIHLDGFADTCDGLYGNKNKEQALQVMRDSHSGAIAVIGVALLLFFKFALLSSIPQENLGKLLIFMLVFSRYSQVFACFLSKYAREEETAKYFVEYATAREFTITTIFTLLLSALIMKISGIILFSLCLFSVLLLIIWIKRKIGGMTGDTIGAVSEVAEVLALFFALFLR